MGYLYELAFDKYGHATGRVGNLRLLEFTYYTSDSDGRHLQRVRIPLLTLVPLPLLQVQEADFEFDIQIIDAVSADKNATFSLKNPDNSTNAENEAPEGVKLRVAMAASNIEKNNSVKSRQGLTANMKVNVKMRQADMPGGASSLLGLITNNLQIEDAGKEG